MSDVYVLQPVDAETELLRDILPADTELPILSGNSLVDIGRVLIGEEEYVTYSGIVSGPAGESVLQNCKRGRDRDKGGSEARSWPGGTRVEQIPWTMVEKTSSVQPPTEDQIGRLVVFRQPGYDDTLNTGITLADGTPVWVELTSRPIDAEENPYYLAWVSNHFTGSGTANGVVNRPSGIAEDAAGNVFVVESWNYRVQKFTSALAYSTKVGSNGLGNGQFGGGDMDLVVAPDNNVYVTDVDNKRIQKFTNNLAYISQWGSSGSSEVTNGTEGNFHFSKMVGIAADSASNIYVADNVFNTVKKYTSAGAYVTRWGGLGSVNEKFESLSAIAIDGTDNVWVADRPTGVGARLQKFSASGTWLATYLVGGTGNGQFQTITDIDFGPDGKLWVLDGTTRQVQVFNLISGLKWVAKFGSAGTGNGQFSNPLALATTDDATVLIVDANNSRIQKIQLRQLTGDPFTMTMRTTSSSAPTGSNTSLRRVSPR